MSNEPRDIERLIADVVEDARDGTLGEKRLEELRELLTTSSEARRVYLKHNQFSRLLAVEDFPAVPSETAVAASELDDGLNLTPPPRYDNRIGYAGWVVAAVLLIVSAVILPMGEDNTSPGIAQHPVVEIPPELPMAVLTRAIDIEWEHPSRFQAEIGKPVTEKWLRVERGVAEVLFSSGATVSIEGPARLRLDSEMHVFSKSGKLSANCPPSAHGFTVRFRGGRVVDLGTEFALDTQPEGNTQVHVLNGEVVVALTDDDENVLSEQNVQGNSAVELKPDEEVIDSIEFDDKPYNGIQREALIRSQPIKLQFDLGHRAGLYKGTNAPAHAADDMFSHEDVWMQIVGDQSGTFLMADGNICPHPIRVDYGHGNGVIDWNAAPVDPSGSIYTKAAPFFDTALCQDHRPWDFDLGIRVAGLPAGTYRVYALCRSIRRPTAAYDVSFGINLDQQLSKPLALPPMDNLLDVTWKEGLTYAVTDVEVSAAEDWVTFITRYSRERSIRTTPHHGRSVLLGLQIVELRD
jgi:hypothetical protein